MYEIETVDGQYVIQTPEVFIPCYFYTHKVHIIEEDKSSIPLVHLKLRDRSKYQGTIIYSHGNSSDMYHSLYFINKFAVNSPFLDYVVYDYTGYGKSKIAEINHNSICRDLELVIKYLNLPNDQIILWGFSLGTYPTTVIAKKYKVKGVVLLSPLASIYSLFTDNLTSYSTFKNDCFSVL